jgi:hypothetical protein
VGRELLAPSLFVAAILATNYALSGVPNVKLFDLLVFVAGYSLGLRRGALVAVAAWLVYGNVNPWGVAQAPLLLTMMGAQIGYAVLGSITRRFVSPDAIKLGPSRLTLALFASAFVATLAYDLATNVYTAFFWADIAGSTDYARWLTMTLFGPGAMLFVVLHVGSNLALFPVFGPLLMRMSGKVEGGI